MCLKTIVTGVYCSFSLLKWLL